MNCNQLLSELNNEYMEIIKNNPLCSQRFRRHAIEMYLRYYNVELTDVEYDFILYQMDEQYSETCRSEKKLRLINDSPRKCQFKYQGNQETPSLASIYSKIEYYLLKRNAIDEIMREKGKYGDFVLKPLPRAKVRASRKLQQPLEGLNTEDKPTTTNADIEFMDADAGNIDNVLNKTGNSVCIKSYCVDDFYEFDDANDNEDNDLDWTNPLNVDEEELLSHHFKTKCVIEPCYSRSPVRKIQRIKQQIFLT
ncbi:hypothetical protein GWI33_020011 [Rhynchophorus ferrugineus]|uniref:Uncharacterized protein n=1 Tax=Rhynchophorus ferrugineus TaxID=354439 RepID=A0A834HRH7_RHYFE|nr:hypothetical protein GWI33_020011 [Rhynchophorus ferrugineus]